MGARLGHKEGIEGRIWWLSRWLRLPLSLLSQLTSYPKIANHVSVSYFSINITITIAITNTVTVTVTVTVTITLNYCYKNSQSRIMQF